MTVLKQNHAFSLKYSFLTFLVILTSIRPLVKYSPNMVGLILFIIAMIVFYIVNSKQLKLLDQALDSSLTPYLLLGILLIVQLLGFSYQLSRELIGLGSDQSQALILAGKHLIHGEYPYSSYTYFNNPISDGPGWIILTLPFTALPLYFLMTPAFLALYYFVAFKIGKLAFANQLSLFLLSSLGTWELMTNGSDLIALGIAFTLLTIMCFYYHEKKLLFKITTIVLIALLSSSRIVFVYMTLFYGFLIFCKKPCFNSALVGISSLALNLILQYLFYHADPAQYMPLHLISKGGHILNGTGKIMMGLSLITATAYILKTKPTTLVQFIFCSWLILFVPNFITSLFDLIARNGKIADWEGVNYVTFTLPLYVYYFMLKHDQAKHSP